MKRKILAIFFCVFLAGCETTKCFLGISVRDIQNARSHARLKVFNLDYQTCYKNVESALKELGAYVYAKEKDLFACYRSYTDTTPVGVFLEELSPENTQIEVSSPSSVVRDDFAQKLSIILERFSGEIKS